jgi:hypothetical protein
MELVARRFADTVAVFPTGRIDHASADAFRAALLVTRGPSGHRFHVFGRAAISRRTPQCSGPGARVASPPAADCDR